VCNRPTKEELAAQDKKFRKEHPGWTFWTTEWGTCGCAPGWEHLKDSLGIKVAKIIIDDLEREPELLN
jgi:hypothetical protein